MNCQPGDRVLEVGVGTGLSLPLYPAGVHVTGIDLVPAMLERAQWRCRHHGLPEYFELLLMDAEHMGFCDSCFDKVAAMYVVSVAPQPARLVSEMRRVCKPYGELFILSHFNSPNPVIGGLERLLAPLSKKLGWRPDLSLETFLRETGLPVLDRTAVNLFGYWLLLRAGNNLQSTAATVSEAAQGGNRPAVQM
jgi:phosphatidylethanolamine/phosphatidyl-N-methylethanolamine N-methyltransferase